MGSKDYRKREAKKQKKDLKKITPVTIVPPTVEVEVIKTKGKKAEEEEEEGE